MRELCYTLLLSLGAAFQLTANTIFVLCENESAAVNLATRDVLSDFYKVLGAPPVILSTGPPEAKSLPPGTPIIWIGTNSRCTTLNESGILHNAGCFRGWESHCVIASEFNGYPTLFATGSGDRGAIFGAYSLSEQILGVNPLYRFVDDPPSYIGSLEVNASFALVVAPPLYKYRGIFINDEDLMGGLRADPLGGNVFDLATFDMFFETALRLKFDGAIIATNPFPDEDCVALASRRGLVVMHHHYDTLGTNVYSWPLSSSDWNFKRDPATMSYVWRASIAAQADFEVLWSVGLRGLNDYAYPCDGPVDCGAQISAALSNQTAWIQAAQPGAPMVLFLWQELLDLLATGDLIVPAGVSVIFTDAGAGFIETNANVTKYAVSEALCVCLQKRRLATPPLQPDSLGGGRLVAAPQEEKVSPG